MTEKHKQQLQETLGYKPPAFQFYPDDWLGSTPIQMMLPEQEGAYIRLLAICWGSPRLEIPSDPARLATMSRLNGRWDELGPLVLSCFETHPIDGEKWLTNVKLVEIRHNSLVRLRAGMEGNKVKHAKRIAKASQTASQTASQNAPLPVFLSSCLPNSQTTKKERPQPSADGLDAKAQNKQVVLKWTDWFYDCYTRTVGHQSPDAPVDGRRTVQDQNAAKKLERQGFKTSGLEPQLTGWLRGDYFKSAGSTLSHFVSILGSLTSANAKKGTGAKSAFASGLPAYGSPEWAEIDAAARDKAKAEGRL